MGSRLIRHCLGLERMQLPKSLGGSAAAQQDTQPGHLSGVGARGGGSPLGGLPCVECCALCFTNEARGAPTTALWGGAPEGGSGGIEGPWGDSEPVLPAGSSVDFRPCARRPCEGSELSTLAWIVNHTRATTPVSPTAPPILPPPPSSRLPPLPFLPPEALPPHSGCLPLSRRGLSRNIPPPRAHPSHSASRSPATRHHVPQVCFRGFTSQG